MDELKNLIYSKDTEFYEKSIEIAKSLKGMDITELLDIFRTIPLNKNVEQVVSELKKRSIKTAIVTDGYQIFADDLKNRLGVDFAFANNLIIDENIVTGELIINNTDLVKEPFGDKIYSICKSCILDKLCKNLDITPEEVISIGDGRVDICMIKKAGLGFAFNAPDEVQKHADICIDDMKAVLEYL